MNNVIFRIASEHIAKTEVEPEVQLENPNKKKKGPDKIDEIIKTALKRHSSTTLGVFLKTLDVDNLLPASNYIVQELSKLSTGPRDQLKAFLTPFRTRLITTVLNITESPDVIAYIRSLIPEDTEDWRVEGLVRNHIIELRKTSQRYLRRIQNLL